MASFRKQSKLWRERHKSPLTGSLTPPSVKTKPKGTAVKGAAAGLHPLLGGSTAYKGGLKPAATLSNPAPGVGKGLKKKAAPKKKAAKPKSVAAAVPKSTSSSSSGASTATRAAVSSPPSASNPSAGAGAAAARRTGKANGAKVAAGTQAGAGTPVAQSAEDPITGLYAAANRDLERRQQLADATRLARLTDQKKYEDWVTAQRGTADETLRAAFAKSAADAQAARAQSYAMINQYANEATRQANGTADLLRDAGDVANRESFGFQSAADASTNAAGAFNQANFAQLQNNQSAVDRARAANMVAGYNAQNYQTKQKLGEEGAQLKIKEMTDRISQQNADRQFGLDAQAAQFLQGLKAGELEVKQYSAKTERELGILNAKEKARANSIAAQIAAGKMDYNRASLQLKRAGLSLQKRKLILDSAKQTGSRSNKLRQDASDFITGWNKDTLAAQGLPAAPRGDEGIAYARSAIGALKSRWPGLKGKDALDMMRGFLPGDVIIDNRILAEISRNFK